MASDPTNVLDRLLDKRASAEALSWLYGACAATQAHGIGRTFLLVFGTLPRRVGKAPLDPTSDELAEAHTVRPGWDPRRWTVSDVARARLVLSLGAPDGVALSQKLDTLFNDADLGELVALYRTLPLLPYPDAHRSRCAEGIRTNMQDVFEAVALDNPYPSEQLDDAAFNQLVLKALFIGSPLYRVVGLDRRTNSGLSRMLVDYASERRSAGRSVSPELWRPVGPFASEAPILEAVKDALEHGSDAERLAIARSSIDAGTAAPFEPLHRELFERVRTSPPDWRDLALGKVP